MNRTDIHVPIIVYTHADLSPSSNKIKFLVLSVVVFVELLKNTATLTAIFETVRFCILYITILQIRYYFSKITVRI